VDLSHGDKSDVSMLCDVASVGTLSLCHELSQLSTDAKRALVENALKVKSRYNLDTDVDTPRSLLGLMLNIPKNGAFP
jgi:hypothetical protein